MSARRTVEQHLDALAPLREALRARVRSRPAELIALGDPDAAGRILAEDVTAPAAVPGFDNSQMDGFAVRAADLPGILPLGTTTAAGDPPGVHRAGTASPVMTGAAIPIGADAVVPVEDTVEGAFRELRRTGEGDPCGTVSILRGTEPGRFIRRAGSDVDQGATVARAGDRLTPRLLGLLAAVGANSLAVHPRPRVLVCATGDELADGEMRPGLIHDANTPMLAASLQAAGAAVSTLRTGDEPSELRRRLDDADVDLVITAGGVSAGAYEVVRDALAVRGATFCSVAMQPGGPQGYGMLGETPVVCVPGNPVSAWLSVELFVLPTLRALAGHEPGHPTSRHPLAHADTSPADRRQYRRASVDADGRVHLSAPGSHLLADLARAGAIAVIPEEVTTLAPGDDVEIWRMDD